MTQGTDFPVHVTKAYRRTRGIAPLILNLGTFRWAKGKQSLYRSGQALKFPGGWDSQIFRQSAHEGVRLSALWTGRLYRPGDIPGIVWPAGLCQWKIPVTPSEPYYVYAMNAYTGNCGTDGHVEASTHFLKQRHIQDLYILGQDGTNPGHLVAWANKLCRVTPNTRILNIMNNFLSVTHKNVYQSTRT